MSLQEKIAALPTSIWVPGDEPSIYRGNPMEIVSAKMCIRDRSSGHPLDDGGHLHSGMLTRETAGVTPT